VLTDVEKGEKAEHATETDEVGKVEELAERCDAKGKDQEAEGPVTGRVLKKFDGIGAQPIVQRAIDETEKRDETKQEDNDFGPFAGEDSSHAVIPDQ